ncbi:MAG: 3-isopropylmalate dehydrogenase [Spirochaetae bacterium HGW-Spirochaetae-9]|nr:MAG: 3-isopropylmalate dehydrogenase [Spirochaetae bacterium HGW-Spirochaetae-9]
MNYSIALIPGDGIGPEVVAQGKKALVAIGERFGHKFSFTELMAGGCAIDKVGVPLPPETLDAARKADAVLMGAMGGPAWDNQPSANRPEKGLLALRAGMGVYANLRPAKLLPQLRGACPIKEEVLKASSWDGSPSFDLLIMRELTGGLYFGKRGRSEDGLSAFDTETYSVMEIERVLRAGFAAAALRRNKLCVVDKANVLESSRLWREVAGRVAPDYPSTELSYMYVDNCAMQLIRAPGQFDVIVTSNLFGDILSDEASVLTGSIGMLPSASLGDATGPAGRSRGLYEPIHGSAPDIAGKNIANPFGTILSAAMLLRYSLGLEPEADALEKAVDAVLDAGLRTADIAAGAGDRIVGTIEMGEAVVGEILSSS